MRLRWLAAPLILLVLLVPATARADTQSPTAQVRLLNVWLDLQLVALMYPKSDPKRFAQNVLKVARQLNQARPRVRQGRAPGELSRYAAGTVVVKVNAPPKVLILYSRDADGRIWQLIDDAKGKLNVFALRDPLAA